MGAPAARVGHADLLRLLVRLRADVAEAGVAVAPGAELAGSVAGTLAGTLAGGLQTGAQIGGVAGATIASLVGLAYRAPPAPVLAAEPVPQSDVLPVPAPDLVRPQVDATQLRARQYQVTLNPATLAEAQQQAMQDAWDAVWELAEPDPLPSPTPPPPFQGISSRQRLTRAVERLVRSVQSHPQPDIARIVQTLARCQQPDWRKLRQQRAAWHGKGVVLTLHAADEPLRSDYYRIMRIVYRRSAGRVPLWLCLPGHGWFVKQNRHTDHREWQARPGLTLPPQATRLQWLALGRLAAGWPLGQVHALWSVEPQAVPLGAPGLPCVGWHEAQPLTVWQRVPPWLVVSDEQVARLLALVSLTVTLEPRLLRALRRLLALPPAAESACWSHADVACDGVAMALLPAKRAGYLDMLARIDLPTRQAAARLIAAHHGDCGLMVQLDDAYNAHMYAAGGEAFDPAPWFASLARQIRGAGKAAGGGALPLGVAELGHYFGRQGFRSTSLAWQSTPAFALAWAWAQRQALASGIAVPDALPLATRASLCRAVGVAGGAGGVAGPEDHWIWRVVQVDDALHLLRHVPGSEPARFAPELARWQGGQRVQWRVDEGQWQEIQLPPTEAGPGEHLPENPVAVIGLVPGQALALCDGVVLCEVQPLVAPTWARGTGRNAFGVFVMAPVLCGEAVPVALPLVAGTVLFQARAGTGKKGGLGLEQILTWDEVGLLATLRVHGPLGAAEQGFRWIEPGTFLMGRPDEEKGDDDEIPQHSVTIRQGFWLADTACSQALWQAVIGQNPARFHEGNQGSPAHPVEQVSWNDVQAFLQQLNDSIGQKQASLPTEAEWEYVCRAGSTTPFCFGEAINSTQVNYNGNYPYGAGEKSQYRGQTVAVKALPANDWGLYQMHGNVWEWCADDKRAYGAEPVHDPGLAAALALPTEPKPEGRAVLRGGSWINDARLVRSASRHALDCRHRYEVVGFRLALRFPASKGF